MGVRRAVDMAIDAANRTDGPICTYGPLIHNPQVLDLLEEKGIPAIAKIPGEGEGTAIIRAHGVPPATRELLEAAGFTVMDATCPRVIKVQTIIRKHAETGHHVIIAGDEDHPEVTGLLGYAGINGHVIDTLEKLNALPVFEKAIIVAQTTQNTRFYDAVRNWAARHAAHYKIFDTICDSTEKRQAEIKKIASEVDQVVVVGGRNSGNTQRLAEVAREAGCYSAHIESVEEIDFDRLSGAKTIGITAGASTPNWIIKKVVKALETEKYRRQKGLRGFLHTLRRWLLRTNVYLSIGAAALSYAASVLQGLSHEVVFSMIAGFYVLSMQIINTLTVIPSDRYNNPDRAALYDRYRIAFVTAATIAATAGLAAAFFTGTLPFAILLAMSLAGLCYNAPVLPRWLAFGKYRSLRDLPGSKTLLIAAAWGLVCAVLPALSAPGNLTGGTGVSFLFVAAMVFVRTAFFDMLDMQGDRIVGKETLPILLGEKRTLSLLEFLLTATCLLLPLFAVTGWVTPFALALVLYPFTLIWVIRAEIEGRIPADAKLDFRVESLFAAAGILAAFWQALAWLL